MLIALIIYDTYKCIKERKAVSNAEKIDKYSIPIQDTEDSVIELPNNSKKIEFTEDNCVIEVKTNSKIIESTQNRSFNEYNSTTYELSDDSKKIEFADAQSFTKDNSVNDLPTNTK